MQHVHLASLSPCSVGAFDGLRIAVVIPCFNEAVAVGKVIDDFRLTLPTSKIYVHDNNSTDRTGEVALIAGAIVRNEKSQGKGHVVRRMFADMEADVHLLVDGDATYDAGSAPKLIETLLVDTLDMVVRRRVSSESDRAYRRGHLLGNFLLSKSVERLYGRA